MNRLAIMLTVHCAVFAIVAPAFIQPVPRLVWNASASVPIGLYSARPSSSAHRGELVAAIPPAPVARLMAERGYLPLGVPMLKHVAASIGQRICRTGDRISIDGTFVAQAKPRDRHGRPLPGWQGCHTLRRNEVFLLNPASGDSFDGRYFGTVSARSIIAVLTPVWILGGGDAASNPSPSPTTKGVSK